mmetsp:Transcript_52227/g.83368  ORF Transcript_52227/g.83368 Transcript_52227/m.83368 type:complete len:591 (+) Transcript_52227:112-1884(+)
MTSPVFAETSDVASVAGSSTQSIEDMLMDLLNKATGGAVDVPTDGSTPSLLFLGLGAFLLYGVFAVLKFVLAAVGGLFVVREIDQQFGKEGRKTSKLVEKALKRFAGEPADLLEERRLKVVRLNDEVTAFQASLAEQVSGPSAGAALRDSARRKRFVVLWQRILDDVAMTDVERQKVEDAVQKYLKEERERQEDFRTARSEWLSSLFANSFFGTMSNRYRVTGSLDKKIRLQEELISNIRKALPDQKKFSNVKKVLGEVDLSWLTDKDPADHQKIEAPKTVYVLSFDGDPTAAGVSLLQQEVTAILESNVKPEEVILKLKSPGGTVTGYGLAAAQLLRFRQHGVRLVCCVDELAASGGYMMACCAHKILISPFAAVGSIGVISGVPNAVERLDREGLKVIQTTAGKWKRTIDPFQAPTPEALAKAEEDVNRIYRQFSGFVKQNRPNIDIEDVATGEVWFGADALEKGLVDELQTSSEYIMQQIRNGHDVLEVSYKKAAGGLGGLGLGAMANQLGEALKARDSMANFPSLPSWLGGQPSLGETASTLSALSALQNLSEPNEWVKGLPEPRMESARAKWDVEARFDRNLPEI